MPAAAKPIERFESAIGVPRGLKTSTVLGYAPGAGLPLPKEVKPEPAPATSVISSAAMKAGEMQRRRLRGRRGRAATIFAGRKPLEPAMTAQAGLKQTLG